MFEKDKLLLSFLLATRLSEFKGEITSEQFRFLLTGGVALDDFLPEKPKGSEWISAKSWGEMYRLSLIDKFGEFLNSVMKHTDDWRKIYDSK